MNPSSLCNWWQVEHPIRCKTLLQLILLQHVSMSSCSFSSSDMLDFGRQHLIWKTYLSVYSDFLCGLCFVWLDKDCPTKMFARGDPGTRSGQIRWLEFCTVLVLAK